MVLPVQQQNMAEQISAKTFNPSTLLWYAAPAAKWEDALPVGNGRLGAMVSVKPRGRAHTAKRRNLLDGGPYSTVVKAVIKYCHKFSNWCLKKKYPEVHNLVRQKFNGLPWSK